MWESNVIMGKVYDVTYAICILYVYDALNAMLHTIVKQDEKGEKRQY